MKTRRTLALTVVLCFLGSVAPAAAQSIRYVDDDAPTNGDGLTWDTAYRYLQDALFEASGDPGITEIHVAGGAYKPDKDEAGQVTPGDREATLQLLNGLALMGGYRACPGGDCGGGDPDDRDVVAFETILSGDLAGDDIPDLAAGLGCFTISNVSAPPDCTVFDADGDGDVDRTDLGTAENSYHVVTGSGVDPTAVLDGFTITAGSGEYTRGAGMYNASGSPAVAHCVFRANYDGADGAGIYNWGSSPRITDCAFAANRSGYNRGGAIANRDDSNPVVLNSMFVANWANAGGALFNRYSSPTVINCAFYGNRCTWSWGGAMWNLYADDISMTDCLFSGNSSNSGGALDNVDSGITLNNCTMVGNHIGQWNSGGGIRQSNGSLVVDNCIFWGNWDSGGTDESAQIRMTGGTPIVRYSCVEGCTEFCSDPMDHNIGDDPLLLDADGPDNVPGTEDDNLRLSGGSPCSDAGSNLAVPPDWADVDGDGDTTERTPLDLWGLPRFWDDPDVEDTGVGDPPDYVAVVDVGAYEYHMPGDLDYDAGIDGDDYWILAAALPGCAGDSRYNAAADLDFDGCVTLVDYQIWLVFYGEANPPQPAPGPTPGKAVKPGDMVGTATEQQLGEPVGR